jgi:B12-binding domain/radical SAM domain protein
MFELMRRDVIFLHAPSIYDFRKDTILFGPINDVIPSSSVFEMYPIGITSIAEHLEKSGFRVQIINVAYRMLKSPNYDPEKKIKKLNPRFWAIDLHWLPHVHGALALAAIIKKYHPDSPVIMGGLSSSYYHEELIKNPNVDFVVRGDSTEGPVLELLKRVRTGQTLKGVPNLTWKEKDGTVVVNPLTNVPDNLNGPNLPAYRYVMRSVFKYWNLPNVVPYLRWMEYPMTTILTARGCNLNCSICGGSKQGYKHVCNRNKPAFRSPEKLIEDLRFIKRFSRAPIFVIHDLRMGGKNFVDRFLDLLKQEKIDNEMVFELFYPADENFFSKIKEATLHFSLEMTLETHDPELRKINGKFAVSNEAIESTIATAMAYGCNRLDIYFMVGLPFQTSQSVMDSMDYAHKLLSNYGMDGKIKVYVAPLAPFLDPGSLAFENPEKFGYKLRAHTLEEHRKLLTNATWGQILNYESLSMPPQELVDTTYKATAKLVEIKNKLGLMSNEEAIETSNLIIKSQQIIKKIEQAVSKNKRERDLVIETLKKEVKDVNSKRVYDQTDFVSWGKRRFQLKLFGIIPLMLELFFEELSLVKLRYSKSLHKYDEKTYWKPETKPLALPKVDDHLSV